MATLNRSKLMCGLVLGAGLVLGTFGVAEAGSITGYQPGRTISEWRKVRVGNRWEWRKVSKVTPGSQSDPVSDFNLGISGSFTSLGVRVNAVDGGGPAERIGLEQGDVILTVDGVPVRTANGWINAMSGKSFVRLRIRNVRGGPNVFRNVDLTSQNGDPGGQPDITPNQGPDGGAGGSGCPDGGDGGNP